MFEPQASPRVFGMPPGADFGSALVDGVMQRASGMAASDLARVTIYVNTTRMQRRLREVFDQGSALLLPRIKLITDLANDPMIDAPTPVSTLHRRLELSQFVGALLDGDPTLAPRSALFELSTSLATLMEEMHGEGVEPGALSQLDVSDESGHWDRALQFLNIVTPFFEKNAAPDKEKRLRQVVLDRIAQWDITPPTDPIIVAGSTGSRGATALFMQAVARAPQGAVVLPGFDFDLPEDVWHGMHDPMVSEDHPQYRFHTFLSALDVDPTKLPNWDMSADPSNIRNKLISLSLRPAPVTDQWLRDGPDLDDLLTATKGITLVEANSPRAEADTIALRLRAAADEGITAALITPDRQLTRQVSAALDRWDIEPDDSAGIPLQLSPPGRFLRQVADMFTGPIGHDALLALLKHPLCNTGDRGPHLRHTRELELALRKLVAPHPDALVLQEWAKGDEDRTGWVAWLIDAIGATEPLYDTALSELFERHIQIAELLSSGPNGAADTLWAEKAGREARRVCDNLQSSAKAGGDMSSLEYATLFANVLTDGVVRDRDAGHPNILIWGTLEARVQSADLVILGGMNEGSWPETPSPDPWLNRQMRKNAGLLLPERRIGLSAHDYQQAVTGKEVWITRSKRSADAETVPSRWVNRLVNLLGGLPNQGGDAALKRMRADGEYWLAMAATLSQPSAKVAPAIRPSPRPPLAARPTALSVTEVKHLIRDPYTIYARKVLRLRQLDTLVRSADAPLRGTIVHKILEDFIRAGVNDDTAQARDDLMALVNHHMAEMCPWPTIRAQWISRIERTVDQFLRGEVSRQRLAETSVVEQYGRIPVGSTGVELICKADRIDIGHDGAALIYDYKTGQLPTTKQQKQFDKQLLLEAAMVTLGAFADLGKLDVAAADFVAMNTTMRDVSAPLGDEPPMKVWQDFETLLKAFQQKPRGYTSRIAMFSRDDMSDYDLLSRFGEWDISTPITPEDLQ